MKRKLTIIAVAVLLPVLFYAQPQAYIQEGEFGIGLGSAHYFGDLNTRARVNRPKTAATIFFRKNFGNYIAARIAASYAQLGYSDIYNKQNEYMVRRNLSFNTNVWELSLQGDFNFYKYLPGEPGYSFTPYVTFGAGIFSYDPFAYQGGQKYYLRQLNTEGQGSALYPDRKPYSSMAVSLPFGAGLKFALNHKMSIAVEALHRFTTTDYLDDVSTTFVDPSVFPNGINDVGYKLSDRSFEIGTPIGAPGVERGKSRQKDQFATLMVHLTFNLQSYRCPTAN